MIRGEWLFYAFLLFIFFDLHFGFANRPFWEYVSAVRSKGLFQNPSVFLSGNFLMIHLLKHFSISNPHMPWWNYLGALICSLALGWYSRKTLPRFLLNVLLLLSLTTAIFYAVNPVQLIRRNQSDKKTVPPKDQGDIFIMIVDEHAGYEGIPSFNGEGDLLKQKLSQHYEQRGFDIYAGAFSNYFDTHNSIPSLLTHTVIEQNTYQAQLSQNPILEKLYAEGFPINIYESDHLNFCDAFKGRYSQCVRYRPNSPGYLSSAPEIPLKDKSFFLIDSFVAAHKSEVLKKIHRQLSLRVGHKKRFRSSAMASIQIFKEIENDLDKTPEGTVFFVHLLMPHYPYIFDENCNLSPMIDWKNRDQHGYGNENQKWEERHPRYFKQMLCLDRKMEELFRALDARGRFKNASFVIFSDHGSRITLSPPLSDDVSKFTSEDWKACFSSWTAVKKGNYFLQTTEGNLIEERIPLAQILNDLFGIDKGDNDQDFWRVYLRKNWTTQTLIPYTMPKKGWTVNSK